MWLPMWQVDKNGHTRNRLTLRNAFVNVQQLHTLQHFCLEARGQLRTRHLGVQINPTTQIKVLAVLDNQVISVHNYLLFFQPRLKSNRWANRLCIR